MIGFGLGFMVRVFATSGLILDRVLKLGVVCKRN